METATILYQVLGGLAIAAASSAIRGWWDKRAGKANEEQALVDMLSAGMTRLEKLRKPDQAAADAAAAAEAHLQAQIKSLQTRAAALLPQ